MEKVNFETNIPVTLSLKFPKGKEVESKIDGAKQVMFTTTDGRVMYHYPPVAEQIAALNLKAGEAFSICKREVKQEGAKPRIEWKVEKLGQQDANPPTPASVSTAHSAVNNHQHTATVTEAAPPVQLPMDEALTQFLIAAGRATREAEKTLGAEGGSVRFDNRDVAALATTLFIQCSREGWLTPPSAFRALAPEGKPEEKPAKEPKPKHNAAQQEIVERKLAELAKAEKPAPEKPWHTLGEMRQVFAELREVVGETCWARECALAGFDPAKPKSANEAYAFFVRLTKLVELEMRGVA